MQLIIEKQSPLSIRDQIKRQIRMLINNNELSLGQALPSARDLSAILHVNRNTVTQAYKELSSEGLLEIVTGSGTFVKSDLMQKPLKTLDKAFDAAVEKAKAKGFSKREIAEHFMTRLSLLSTDHANKRILVVDCNDEVINHLSHLISTELGAHTQGMLINEIEKDPKQAADIFKGKDLLVCGFNHIKELLSAVPDPGIQVATVLLQVDAKVINTLAQLPSQTVVGFVCANQRSTETFYNTDYFSGGKALKRILAGYDNSAKLKKVIRECDVIFATNYVFDRMRQLTKPHQKLINVKLSVDSSNIDLIREMIA